MVMVRALMPCTELPNVLTSMRRESLRSWTLAKVAKSGRITRGRAIVFWGSAFAPRGRDACEPVGDIFCLLVKCKRGRSVAIGKPSSLVFSLPLHFAYWGWVPCGLQDVALSFEETPW